MKEVYLIFGNQQLEIEEEFNRLTTTLLPESREEAIFTFDVEDFFSKDQNQNRKLIDQFKNTCQTVSFFSPVILIHLKNLQKLVVKNKHQDPITKRLEKIVLVKKEYDNELVWFDADSLMNPPQTHFRISGKQIVRQAIKSTEDTLVFTLENDWQNRNVMIQKENIVHTLTTKEFFIQKLSANIVYKDQETTLHSPLIESSDFITLLCQLVESPPPQVKLVLSANIKNTRELDQKIFSLIKKNAVQIKKSILYDDSRPVSWVIERAQKKQLKIDTMMAGLLIEMAGSDFNTLDMELEKLSIVASNANPLTPEIILKSVSHSKNYTVFKITDSLTRKNLGDSLNSVESLLENNSTDFNSIFSLVSAHFRKLLRISWLAAQDLPEKHIINQLDLNPWVAGQLLKQIKNFTTKELEHTVVFLAKSDIQLKYSAKDAKPVLENLCYLICSHDFRNSKPIKNHWL